MPTREGGFSSLSQNRLWQSRKRRGIVQKQVASLLAHKTIDQLSRYEQGLRLPNLPEALILEVVYGLPVRLLFYGLYEQLRAQVLDQARSHASLKALHEVLLTENGEADFCAYQELLRNPHPSPAERDRLRRHVIHLTRQLAGLQ